ncbi:MAG TPA: hypothetical protein VFL76_05700 [Edaphocola sp.]|nr:hypothetical protein [Edaphocola sp.]
MDNKVFDQILRERFKNDTLPEQIDGWQKLSAMLPATRKRRSLVYWKIAASLLLVSGLSIGFNFLFRQSGQKPLPSGITGNQSTQIPTKISRSSAGIVQSQATGGANKALTTSSDGPSTPKKDLTGNTMTSSAWSRAHTPVGNHYDITVVSKSQTNKIILPKHQTSVLPGNSEAKQDLPANTHKAEIAANDHNIPVTAIDPPDIAKNPIPGSGAMPANHRYRATAIAFGGGMNYGVLNTGYNLNLTARHSLGRHIFIEGAIAFLYNGQAEKSSTYAVQNFLPTRPAPGQVSASHTTNPAASNFYYLSVNPSMGYQINKTIALSAGPDLQQRIASLGQDGTAIYTPGRDPRIIPQLDLGFTGKADFLISPKIETGILFRNGLNNLLKKPDLHPYLNRRYIQVQLKYNFLLGK